MHAGSHVYLSWFYVKRSSRVQAGGDSTSDPANAGMLLRFGSSSQYDTVCLLVNEFADFNKWFYRPGPIYFAAGEVRPSSREMHLIEYIDICSIIITTEGL